MMGHEFGDAFVNGKERIPMAKMVKAVGRVLLGAFLIFAGISHFRATDSFMAQVPPFLPAPEFIVLASGVVEVVLGAWLVSGIRKVAAGLVVAAFFVAVFPGNISQYLTGASAFGLDSDAARAIRLLFQPVLIGWALASTGAWGWLRGWIRSRRHPADN